ncbi:MAG: hypothetical protein H0X69_07100 [Gemmatimonadales bacterium]|nr:hypothetical protein [Gemmatimonadales bacterium]
MKAAVLLLSGTLVLVGGCADREVAAAERHGRTVVDSAVPIAVALERFRRDVPRPQGLEGGFGSREDLIRGFVAALEMSDTAALNRMLMRKDEFAWLYYPSSHLSQAPYELPPDLLWFQFRGEVEKGASLLLSERAGRPLGYVGHDCATERSEGENRIHGHCVLRRMTAAGDTLGERLFGLVVERGGRFKFVSYANKL